VKSLRYLIPLAIFLALAGFFAAGLLHDPREIPSPFIGKAAPDFKLVRLHEGDHTFTPAEMRGKVWLLNVWASWCVTCRVEHPLLVQLARQHVVPIVGLDYKDTRAEGLKWLAGRGDPYDLSVCDDDGKVGIDYGVYGVPETFVIDKEGVIRYKQIGAITPEALDKTILPLVRKLQG
jgi:cytochrome c biogenesis protein CcmG, thiol:disulfide interchange protein DsbE